MISTYFLSIPRNVLNFEPSSWAFSGSATVAGGVAMASADAVEVAPDGVGDALFRDEPDDEDVMIAEMFGA